jgi:hypothetical protein
MAILNKLFAESRQLTKEELTSVSGGNSVGSSTCGYYTPDGAPAGSGTLADDSTYD